MPRRAVVCLGLSQLICWGISFYLIGVFGDLMMADLGWSRPVIHGGFSAALLAMGLTSPLVGRLIDRVGGRRVMAAGSLLCAAGCAGLALAQSVASYYLAWIGLGVAMRATLYYAAFAALARIGGASARRPMAQVALLGGLASSCFWPIGHVLAETFGWRGALLAYAGIALLTVPLHLAIPAGRLSIAGAGDPRRSAGAFAAGCRGRPAAAALYALIVMLTNGLSSGLSAHLIGVLTALGLGASLAVSVSALRGVGQTLARLAEILFGRRVEPVDLNLAAALIVPAGFAAGIAGAGHVTAAAVMALGYGAGNGLATITGGTLPLVLFGDRGYGALVGKLLVPSFLFSATTPLIFAAVIEWSGPAGALYLALAFSLTALAAALCLKALVIGREAGRRAASNGLHPP